MTATFHHGDWATTRSGQTTTCRHASGWAITHNDGSLCVLVASPAGLGELREWDPCGDVADVADLMAALIYFRLGDFTSD